MMSRVTLGVVFLSLIIPNYAYSQNEQTLKTYQPATKVNISPDSRFSVIGDWDATELLVNDRQKGDEFKIPLKRKGTLRESFSKDSRFFTALNIGDVGEKDSVLLVYDLHLRKMVFEKEIQGLGDIHFSPDSSYFSFYSEQSYLVPLDDPAKTARSFPLGYGFYSPDSKFFYLVSSKSNDEVTQFNLVDSSSKTFRRAGTTADFRRDLLSPDGKFLGLKTEKEKFLILDTATMKPILESDLGFGWQKFTYSPDSSHVVVASWDKGKLINLNTLKVRDLSLCAIGTSIDNYVDFSPDSKYLAYCQNLSEEVFSLRLLSIDGSNGWKSRVINFPYEYNMNYFPLKRRFSQDGSKILLTYEGKTEVIPLHRPWKRFKIGDRDHKFVISSDQKKLAVLEYDLKPKVWSAKVVILDFKTGVTLGTFDLGDFEPGLFNYRLTLSPDGRFAMFGLEAAHVGESAHSKLTIFDLEKNDVFWKSSTQWAYNGYYEFSPNSRFFWHRSRKQEVEVVELPTPW